LEPKGRWGQLKEIITRTRHPSAQGGLRIALIYAAVGALWIIFSDLAVDWIFGRSGTTFIAQTLKGWFFVCASALLTTTMPRQRDLVAAVRQAGLRARVMVGGAPITRDWFKSIKADGYSEDAIGAVHVAKQLMGVE
jgi:hypothetical protein